MTLGKTIREKIIRNKINPNHIQKQSHKLIQEDITKEFNNLYRPQINLIIRNITLKSSNFSRKGVLVIAKKYIRKTKETNLKIQNTILRAFQTKQFTKKKVKLKSA